MRTLLCSRTARMVLTLFALGLIVQLFPGPRAEVTNEPLHMVHDWSMRHVVYPHFGPMSAMLAVQQDPRARFSWRRRLWSPNRRTEQEPLPSRLPRPRRIKPALERDWSINLGTAGTPLT